MFVNLPVKNLGKSIIFFSNLGFAFNPEFTNDVAACMVIGENMFAMLLAEKHFKAFTQKDICDATKYTEVLIALNLDTKEKVIEMVNKAVASGGSIYMEPKDNGWMYGHSFADLDGHQWEVFSMDKAAMPK